jgi:hypothetical protein
MLRLLMSRVGKVKLIICEISMSARFKVNICKSKVEISPSHNRPTKKMWMESLLKVRKLNGGGVLG